MIRTAVTPLSMFISYAPVPKDEALLANFEAHLSVLEEQGLITFWHRRKLLAGMDTEQEPDRHLESASLILLLLSADYSSSDLCRKEMQRALARHENGITIVVPIFLRPVHHQGMPFKHLLCLPRDERPVTSWGNNDEAFTAIVTEIRALVEHASPSQGKSMSEKERRLKACLVDDRDFVREHLDHFVGRQQELAEIEKHILQCLPMGGYVIIAGQAGQGKSCIIAKLVEKYGGDQVPYHCIPLRGLRKLNYPKDDRGI
jgi:TIR domain